MDEPRHTTYALTYVVSCKGESERVWTDDDLASAYDEGLRHGVDLLGSRRSEVRAYLHALRVVNSYQPPEELKS